MSDIYRYKWAGSFKRAQEPNPNGSCGLYFESYPVALLDADNSKAGFPPVLVCWCNSVDAAEQMAKQLNSL
ncbi:hypothetical protein ACE1B6_19630 [Aerosakkonemataceae cyanobacterium BLCC-F154]|uniref:Uncharacterized protein n=1 Tax=Floridaenema fluviatile BLCC-F154 TaxID=3153640 RepID=A0ABV4YF55_9CYAN